MSKKEAEDILNRFTKIQEKREKLYKKLYLINKAVYKKKREILVKKLKEFLYE